MEKQDKVWVVHKNQTAHKPAKIVQEDKESIPKMSRKKKNHSERLMSTWTVKQVNMDRQRLLSNVWRFRIKISNFPTICNIFMGC